MPDERVRLDHLEAKEIVELLESELLHFIGRDADVPQILIHEGNNNSWSAGRRLRTVVIRRRVFISIRGERIFIDETDFSLNALNLCID